MQRIAPIESKSSGDTMPHTSTLVTIIGLVFCLHTVVARADDAVKSSQVPDYCVSFSSDACERIKSVIESGIRPAYCTSKFTSMDKTTSLTAEQLRICQAWPNTFNAETVSTVAGQTQRVEDAAKQKQRVEYVAEQNKIAEDARAMVMASWMQYAKLIEAISMGYQCKIVEEVSASVAVRIIQVSMQNELNRAGLFNDTTMSVDDFSASAIKTGKAAATSKACSRISPEWRGRLRAMVSDLIQMQ